MCLCDAECRRKVRWQHEISFAVNGSAKRFCWRCLYKRKFIRTVCNEELKWKWKYRTEIRWQVVWWRQTKMLKMRPIVAMKKSHYFLDFFLHSSFTILLIVILTCMNIWHLHSGRYERWMLSFVAFIVDAVLSLVRISFLISSHIRICLYLKALVPKRLKYHVQKQTGRQEERAKGYNANISFKKIWKIFHTEFSWIPFPKKMKITHTRTIYKWLPLMHCNFILWFNRFLDHWLL